MTVDEFQVTEGLSRLVIEATVAVQRGDAFEVHMPFYDGLGEPFVFVVRSDGEAIRIDDDGALFLSMGRLAPLTDRDEYHLDRFVAEFLKTAEIQWDENEQTAALNNRRIELCRRHLALLVIDFFLFGSAGAYA